MEEVTKRPPRIMKFIKHCIKEIFPKTIIDPQNNQCLNQFFRLKNKWCTNGESGSERPFLEKKIFISGNKNFVDRRLFVYIKCKIFLAASPKK